MITLVLEVSSVRNSSTFPKASPSSNRSKTRLILSVSFRAPELKVNCATWLGVSSDSDSSYNTTMKKNIDTCEPKAPWWNHEREEPNNHSKRLTLEKFALRVSSSFRVAKAEKLPKFFWIQSILPVVLETQPGSATNTSLAKLLVTMEWDEDLQYLGSLDNVDFPKAGQ